MERKHLIGIAIAGLLTGATACGAKGVETPINSLATEKFPNVTSLSDYSLQIIDEFQLTHYRKVPYRIIVTRINPDHFLLADNTSLGDSGQSTGHLYTGVDYMRARGCQIIGDMKQVTASSAQVEVSNDKDCLPELK